MTKNSKSSKQSKSVIKMKIKPAGLLLVLVLVLLIIFIALPRLSSAAKASPISVRKTTFNSAKNVNLIASVPAAVVAGKPATIIAQESVTTMPTVQTQTIGCGDNNLNNLLIASISQRRLWVCNGPQVVYQTAVVTGNMNVIEDASPVGTFHIYAKETNLYLRGSDSTGSWNDHVNYWMPFLDNQYGVFGLHDATWRAASNFGAISPYSSNASHGCIELPLAAAQWIFNWASIGTAITIES